MPKLVAIIPARGNSKRLPGKNVLPFNGVPLFERAVKVACDAAIFSDIIVTSENYHTCWRAVEMKVIAQKRHSYISDDSAQTATVVFDTLANQEYRWDTFCVLNPTSPLRTVDQLRELWDVFKNRDVDCLMTYVDGAGLDFPPHHDGLAIFAKTLPFLARLDFYKMNHIPYVHGWPSVDINTQEDWDLAERMDRGVEQQQ